MATPVDAGALIVDTTSPPSKVGRIIYLVVLALLALATVGDHTAWPLLAFFGAISVLTVGVVGLVRLIVHHVIAVHEQGLVVRHAMRTRLVPWASVERLYEQQVSSGRGTTRTQFVVMAEGKKLLFGFAAGERPSSGLTEAGFRAAQAIEERTGKKLEHMIRSAPDGRHRRHRRR